MSILKGHRHEGYIYTGGESNGDSGRDGMAERLNREEIERRLEDYAASYERMDGTVQSASVAYDIRQNMIPAIRASLGTVSEPVVFAVSEAACEGALRELVRLKELKDKAWLTPDEKADYAKNKPLAWASAKEALRTVALPSGTVSEERLSDERIREIAYYLFPDSFTDREKCEQAIRAALRESSGYREDEGPPPGYVEGYEDGKAVGYREAVDDAAKVCERVAVPYQAAGASVALECAAAIRALPPRKEGEHHE